MSKTIWYYDTKGRDLMLWRNEDEGHLWTVDGRNLYWEDRGWWFAVADGRASYYLSDDGKWVYTAQGEAAFFRGD